MNIDALFRTAEVLAATGASTQGDLEAKGVNVKLGVHRLLSTQFGLLLPEATQYLRITDPLNFFLCFVDSLDVVSLEKAISVFDYLRSDIEILKVHGSHRHAYFDQLLDCLRDLVVTSIGQMKEHKTWVEDDASSNVFEADEKFRDRDFVPADIIDFLVAAYPVFHALADLLPKGTSRENRKSALDEFQGGAIRRYGKSVSEFVLPDYSFS
jgi:hypothetical protein